MIKSLQKKFTKLAIRQGNENFKTIKGREGNGIIGGSDSFTIIGESGIGKSSTIQQAIHLLAPKKVIEIQSPFVRVAPCIVVQCPFDCSIKGLLLEILPYYARFLCEEKRNKAYESLYYQRGNYHNVMPMPIENGTRYFRYCPLCVKEDREKLGETYWHRNHQLIGVNVCPIHKC